MNLKPLTVSVAPQLDARLREELVRNKNWALDATKTKHQFAAVQSLQFLRLAVVFRPLVTLTRSHGSHVQDDWHYLL
jgi:hypothetical protein